MKKIILSIASLALMCTYSLAQNAPAFTTLNGNLSGVLTSNDPNGAVGGTISLTNGIQLNGVVGGHETRVFRNIGLLNDNSYSASCDVRLTGGNDPGHFLMAFTAGTQDVLSNVSGTSCSNTDISTDNCNYTLTNQDAIEVMLFNPNGNLDIATSGTAVSVYTKDGNGAHVSASTPINIPANAIGNFSVRFVRTSLTTGTIVCINNSSGLEIGNSNVVIPNTIIGLNTIQSGVNTSSNNSRNLTGNFNNIQLNNCVGLAAPSVNTNMFICSGNSAKLSSYTPLANPLYSWFEGTSNTVLATTQNYTTPALTTSKTYSVSYTSTAGAGRGCISPRSSVVVTVNPTPIVAPINTTETVFCSGKIALFTCATTNGTWSTSNKNIATISSNGILTSITSGTVDIIYTIKNSSNCVASSKKSIVVGDKVQPFSIVGTTPNCPGSNATYTVNPIVANARYYWVLDNGVSMYHYDGVSTKVNVSFPDAPGANYTLKAVAINACGSTAEVVYPISIKSDVPNKPKMICSDIVNCTTLSLQTPPNSGVTVSWNNGGTIVSGVNSVTRTKDKQVYVTFSKNGCNYSDSYFAGYCVAGTPTLRTGNERVETELTTIYPNPNDGNFTFETSGVAGNAYILNSMGDIVSEISLENSKTFYQLNLSNLLKGTYILKIVDGVSLKNSVFIVQ
jgi:hypothetical protein